MYLYWYKKNKGINNFGDDLNPYILERLTGHKVIYLPIAEPKFKRTLKSIKRLFLNQISFKDFSSVLMSLISRKYFVAIGSIIESVKGKNCYVWGAGLINRNGLIKNCNFYAVRGEITKARIKELGYKLPNAIGDPALLLPIIYSSNSEKKYELGIIPHYVQNEEILNKSYNDDILFINLLNTPEIIIDQINSCKKTISSSLHGIIVSHAYGIPSLWCNLGNTALHGDDVKFEDYFSSVNIPSYSSFKIKLNDNVLAETDHLFTEHQNCTGINTDLLEIQRNLIKNAPFEILKKYEETPFNLERITFNV